MDETFLYYRYGLLIYVVFNEGGFTPWWFLFWWDLGGGGGGGGGGGAFEGDPSAVSARELLKRQDLLCLVVVWITNTSRPNGRALIILIDVYRVRMNVCIRGGILIGGGE